MSLKSKIYSNFKLRKWQRLSLTEKVAVLQQIENLQAKKLKRPVYSVVVEDLEKGVGGRCSYSTKRIIIDINEFSKVSNRFYLISIIFHEGRHAYQRDEIDEKQNHHFLSREYKWQKNLEGYVNIVNSGKSVAYYSMQPVERDANRYAIRQLKWLRFRFLFNEDFNRTLKNCIYDYKQDRIRARKELGIFYRIKIAFNNFKMRKRKQKNK